MTAQREGDSGRFAVNGSVAEVREAWSNSSPGRRALLLASVTVFTLAMIASALVLWLPHYRPSLGAGEAYGIDVSSHQGEIDWRAAAEDGLSVAYIKATEGGDYTDSRFQPNWTEAENAGLKRGAYHFFTLCSPGQTQAANFSRIVPVDPTALAPAIDLELAGNCSSRPAKEDVQRELLSFVQEVERAHSMPVLLYIGADFEGRYAVSEWLDRPVWLRSVLRRPTGNWQAWQVMGFGNVRGIDGRVDIDIFTLPK